MTGERVAITITLDADLVERLDATFGDVEREIADHQAWHAETYGPVFGADFVALSRDEALCHFRQGAIRCALIEWLDRREASPSGGEL